MTEAFTPTIEREATPEDLAKAKSEFWAKMKKFAGKVPFSKDVVSLYYFIKDPAVNIALKGAAVFALLYFISPVDMVPDTIPLAGLLDDAGVVAGVISLLGSQLKPYKERAAEWFKRGSSNEE